MATQEAPDLDDYDETQEEETVSCWGKLQPLNTDRFDTFHLTDEDNQYTIGRDGDFKIASQYVSGKHCSIWKTNGAVFLKDTSTNGTYIKGEKVGRGKQKLLSSGTKITLVKANQKSKVEEITFLYLDGEEEQAGGVFDKYKLTETLGQGAFAEVRRGINKETHEQYAIKIIDKKKYCKSETREKSLMDEVSILREINHPGVVGIEDVYDAQDYLYLVLELVSGGELFDLIVAKGMFEEDEARPLFKQMLDVLVYLHGKGIAHRDLKFENILLKDKKYDTIKISDFGLSRIIKEGSFMQTICGTPEYLAPEVLSESKTGYSIAVDMWSMGVILYTMVCGQRPFEASGSHSVFKVVQKGIYQWPDDIEPTPEVIDLVGRLLTVDPEKRITAQEAIEHPWITGKAEGTPEVAAEPTEGVSGSKKRQRAPTARSVEATENEDDESPATKRAKTA